MLTVPATGQPAPTIRKGIYRNLSPFGRVVAHTLEGDAAKVPADARDEAERIASSIKAYVTT